LPYAAFGGDWSATDPALHVLVKLPPIAFDVALILVVYAATASLARVAGGRGVRTARDVRTLALASAAVIAFHPAVLYDSAVWAQTDAAITAAMLGAVLLIVSGRPATGWAVWVLGALLKPQPVIIVPVLLVLTLRAGGSPAGAARALGRSMLAVFIVVGVVLGPWLYAGEGRNLAHVYHQLFFEPYPRLSASAWNLWWFWDMNAAHHATRDALFGWPVSYRTAGGAMSALAAVLAMAYAWRRPVADAPGRGLRAALIATAYLAFAFYLLPVSSHERYLYPFLGLLLPVAIIERRWLWLYVPVSLSFFANLICAAPPVQSWSGHLVTAGPSQIAAGANLAMFLAFTVVLVAGLLPARAWRQHAAVAQRATGAAVATGET
jgi:dolichyl-phosphate-mannose-protein mannosyltransferase